MDRCVSETCVANGINIHYFRTYSNKQPLILLHGLMGSGSCWTYFAKELEKDYDLIMPDARGHGKSSVTKKEYDYETLAADVWSFINALKISSPILLGHSMGGMTAAVLASQHPDLLSRLILVDPTFLKPQRQIEVYQSDVLRQHCQILNTPIENFLDEMYLKRRHRPKKLIKLMVEARYQTSANAFDILKPPNPDYQELIRNLTIPSLLIIAGKKGVLSLQDAKKLAEINSYLTVVQISEAGHGLPYDQPGRLAVAVKEYLNQLK